MPPFIPGLPFKGEDVSGIEAGDMLRFASVMDELHVDISSEG